MTIQDHGSQKNQDTHAGQGLKNMIHRAKKAGGDFSFIYDNGFRTDFLRPLKS